MSAEISLTVVERFKEKGDMMATKLVDMTSEEFLQIVEEIVEQKLRELLDDPDRGQEIQETLKQRLVQQKAAVANGERGTALRDVLAQLNLG